MKDRSTIVSRLINSQASRAAYIKSKLSVLISSQIRALRLKSETPKQSDLALAAGMKQSRISAIETPGAVNFNLETLVRLASVFKVGLLVKFVPFSEMLNWENNYSQDEFDVMKLDNDKEFLYPVADATTDAVQNNAVEANEAILNALKTGRLISPSQILNQLGNTTVVPSQSRSIIQSEDFYGAIGHNTSQSPGIYRNI